MRILALETSATAGSVAALSDDNVLTELHLPQGQGSAQSLAPGIHSVLETAGWRAADVDLIAVTTGPGSFTGLRVGVATTKTFAYCIGAPVLGVDTLEVIAQSARQTEIQRLSVAMDAQRGQVVWTAFTLGAAGWFVADGPWRLSDASDWLGSVPAGFFVSGPVLRKLSDRLPAEVRAVDPRHWFPTASSVGLVAYRDAIAGRREDLWSLIPKYSRPSAAEEKLHARLRS